MRTSRSRKIDGETHSKMILNLPTSYPSQNFSQLDCLKTKNIRQMAFQEAIHNQFNDMLKLGENGAPEYTDIGVGSDVLALSQIVRGGNPRRLTRRILTSGSTQDVLDLLVLIFVTRNCRGGKGEKTLAYDMFLLVFTKRPDTAIELLKLFPHYGYWKDLLHLIKIVKGQAFPESKKDAFFKAAVKIMSDQLATDMQELQKFKEASEKTAPSISLLVKWLPRENASLDKSTGVVNALATEFFRSAAVGCGSAPAGVWQSRPKRLYRKVVSQLTAQLSLPEVLLAAQREEEIKFGLVASRATMLLRRVFMNQDQRGNRRSERPQRIAMADRFVEHLVSKGLNGSQLMPHEIVQQIMTKKISQLEEVVLDALWKSLRDSVVARIQAAQEAGMEPTRLLPLSDVSGSMTGTPMAVSIALGILISEITHPAFRNMVLTFTADPTWHLLDPSDTIVEKVRSLQSAPWGMNTDFTKAYRLILKVARDNKLQRADVPSMVVFSDMQFDEAQSNSHSLEDSTSKKGTTIHQTIKKDFKATAEALGWEDSEPTPMVYWNLRNTGGHPVNRNTEGAVLLSGFSPSLLRSVMTVGALDDLEVEVVDANGEVASTKVRVTPESILRKMLNDELYDPVRKVLATSRESEIRPVQDIVGSSTVRHSVHQPQR